MSDDGRIRIEKKLIRKIKIEATKKGESIKKYVTTLVERKLSQNTFGRGNYGKQTSSRG